MPRLAEIQSLFRQRVLTGEAAALSPFLSGGQYPERRLSIHQRHYEKSLVTALLTKFPATTWLAGLRFVTDVAIRFVHKYPPQAPCIAEYGRKFPPFLSACASGRTPYLQDFAELEWCVGEVAIAVDATPITRDQLSRISPDVLPDAMLMLQPGIRYLQTSWPVDQLMKLYLQDSAPDQFSMDPLDAWLEVRGARDEFRIDRLGAPEFTFRKSLQRGSSLGEAAQRGLDADGDFDPGRALAALIAAGLVIAIGESKGNAQ